MEADSAATVELIYALLGELGVELDRAMADCLYTGLATDTGCFRYRNVTPRTHRIAADLLELGAQSGDINQRMFESKSRGQVEAERIAMDSLAFSSQGLVAILEVPIASSPGQAWRKTTWTASPPSPGRSKGWNRYTYTRRKPTAR